MELWREYKIGDLCSTISDTYHGDDKEVILINTSDVLEGKILNHTPVENDNLKGQFKKTFQTNDILYSEIRPANKRFAYVDLEDTSRYIASTKLMVLRPNTELVLPKYLFAILRSQALIDELQHLAEARSGTFPQITFSTELAPKKVLLPPLEEQRKIVGILDAFDQKISLNDQMNEYILEYAHSLYQYWFIDLIPFDGVIPADWSIGKLGDIARIKTNSFSPSKNIGSMVEHYSIPAYDESRYPVFELADDIKSNKYYVDRNSLLVSKLNPETKRIWRPYCFSDITVCSTEFIVFEAINPDEKDFVYAVIDSEDFHDFMCANVTGSTGSRQRTMPKATLNYKVIIPTKDVIHRFSDLVSRLYELFDKNTIENRQLLVMRDSMLPELVSGSLRVDELPL